MRISRRLRHFALSLTLLGIAMNGPALADPNLTLEKIMSDPIWIGQWPDEVRFAPGGTIMYSRHAHPRGAEVVEINEQGKVLMVYNTPQLPAEIDLRGEDAVFSWQGDLFAAKPNRYRLTRTTANESSPRWLDSTQIAYQGEDGPMLRNLSSGAERQLATFVFEGEANEANASFVERQQDRLFPLLKERETFQEAQSATVEIPTLNLGEGRQLVRAELALDQKTLLVVDSQAEKPRRDSMPKYVTRQGYVDDQELRVKVGDDASVDHQLSIFDLSRKDSRRKLSLTGLPTWTPERAVRVEDARWSNNGRLALMLLSQDFEDRWLVEVDFANAKLKLIEHLHDPAWHSWDLNEFGWTTDGKSFWYQSEKPGYAHLYLWDGKTSTALTHGTFEATSIHPSPDGRYFYYRANRERPSQYDIYRVDRQGKSERITTLGGNSGFDLSPDGRQIVFLHSRIEHPPEVYLQGAEPGDEAHQLTHSTSPEFAAMSWTIPSIVAVPSSHQSRPIPAKLYLPQGGPQPGGAAVVFVHGAGYLQNSDEGWSYYFREFMFHSLLNRLGVTVLDMDYRASAGYGREWRTAIYRQMGTPELQDLEDGVSYLVKQYQVAPDRVGVYGGSYGGFMTLMALFKEPDLFACGAALRPVTDWAQYEHEYTARILNTPEEDPEAYLRSSPIEFAEGLNKPLLIAHGMLDDNVVVQDSVRLTQRLIQLRKENWETALYPMEAHSFMESDSWLDEYRRILKLFTLHLDLPSTPTRP